MYIICTSMYEYAGYVWEVVNSALSGGESKCVTHNGMRVGCRYRYRCCLLYTSDAADE